MSDEPAFLPIQASVLKWFVDRDQEQKHFEQMLRGTSSDLLLLIKGDNGIGKTWLLLQLLKKASDQKVPCAYIDLSSSVSKDRLGLMHECATWLGEDRFATFQDELSEGFKVEVINRSPRKRRHGGVKIEAGRDVVLKDTTIIAGDSYEIRADNPKIADIWYERLTNAFIADLGDVCRESKVALLIDTYESALDETRKWIKDQLLGRLGTGQLGCLIMAIAGEEVPHLAEEWQDISSPLEPNPFAVEHIRSYLQDKRQLSVTQDFVENVSQVTLGQPYLLGLIANRPKKLRLDATTDELNEILIQGLLEKRDEDDPEPQAILTAAIPSRFDAEYMAEMLPQEEDPDDLVTRLAQLSFIETEPGGLYRIAEPARLVLLKKWQEQPLRLKTTRQKAGKHFERRAGEELDLAFKATFRQEAVGLALESGDAQALKALDELFNDYAGAYELEKCESTLRRVRQAPDMAPITGLWLDVYSAQLAQLRDEFNQSETLLKEILHSEGADREVKAAASWRLAQLKIETGQWGQAAPYAEEALNAYAGASEAAQQSQVQVTLGDLHLRQAQAIPESIQPLLKSKRTPAQVLKAIPAWLVSLPLSLYGRLIRRWKFLPPLQFSLNYTNWTLARLLFAAVDWFQTAEQTARPAGEEHATVQAEMGLVQVYQRLGWWKSAQDGIQKLLQSKTVQDSSYRKAQVHLLRAEAALPGGCTNQALGDLQSSASVFEKIGDRQLQGRACAGLARCHFGSEEIEQGLESYSQALKLYSAAKDFFGLGIALQDLRVLADDPDLNSSDREKVNQLIDSTPLKSYLPRLTDRYTLVMQSLLAALLGLVFVGTIILLARAALSPAAELLTLVSRPTNLLLAIGVVLGLGWLILLLVAVIGLVLVALSGRQSLQVEKLDRLVTTSQAIERYDYMGVLRESIRWDQLSAIVKVDRSLWRRPIRLVSHTHLYGPQQEYIQIPGTMDGYSQLQEEIDTHLKRLDLHPPRLDYSVSMLRSLLGVLLLLSPFFLLLNRIFGWNLLNDPLPAELAAAIAGISVLLGQIGLNTGPYWWVLFHPLRVRFRLKPASLAPWLAGAAGLTVMIGAFALAALRPFYAVRNLLNVMIAPAGFALFLFASAWILSARTWEVNPTRLAGRVYSRAIRLLAGLALVVGIAASGFFILREIVPYYYLYRAFTFYHRELYSQAIQNATHALDLNDDLADGLVIRSLSYLKNDQPQASFADLDRLIEQTGEKMAHYRLYRARAYHANGEVETACQELSIALEPDQVWVNQSLRQQAINDGQTWECFP